MKNKTQIKTVVLLGDLHLGSNLAMVEPGFTNLDGLEIKQGPFGEWLWQCWQEAQDFIANETLDKEYALVLMGDLIEGNHHNNKQIISPEIEDHVALAESVLTPVARRATKTFVIQGTECHTNGHEDNIARHLGAEKNPITKKHTFVRLERTINGTKSVFRHHIGTTTRTYLEASALSIHLAEEQVVAAKAGIDIPKVLVCAHRHKYGVYTDGLGLALVSPPWQMGTRYAHKVVPNPRVRPGVVVLHYEEPGKPPRVSTLSFETPISECEEI